MRSIVLIVIGMLAFSPLSLFAQLGDLANARKAQLERDLQALETEIGAQRKLLEGKQQEKVSLERDVAILDAQIKEAELSIKARNLNIQRLTQDINDKQSTINKLSDKLVREKNSLGEILRKTHEIDSFSLAEVVLSNKDFSDFFADIGSFSDIRDSLQNSFTEIEETKTTTAEEKSALEDKKLEEVELRQIQEAQKKRIQEKRTERNNILKITKGQEEAYQKILQSKEKDAASIRSELFQLQGSRSISFGAALDYAEQVGKKTGVRPALILGIIAEETNLGENIGTGSWRVDMKNPRDTVPFEDICRRLGLDPDKMPVSKKPWYGWGGAMGPAQFIPSTWVLYEKKIADATGHNPPNPWDPFDAFSAAAILLKENGAAKGTYQAERLAALRYLAGWTNATKAAYAFYGNDVMELAAKYQKQIDILRAGS